MSGNESDRGILATFAATTVSSLGKYWHFMTSASWGVERDFIELNEYLSLPLASPDNDASERILQLVARAQSEDSAELRRAVDEIVFDIYDLSQVDRSRIQEKMQSAIGRFYQHVLEPEQLRRLARQYERALRDALQVTFPTLNVSTQVVEEGPYRAVAVTFGTATSTEARGNRSQNSVDIDLLLRELSEAKDRPTAVIAEPSGFYLDDDTVFLVKTTEADRWSNDSALDDAERVLAALTAGSRSSA